MFYDQKYVKAKDIEAELKGILAGMDTPYMVFPLKTYLVVCLALWIRDYYEPETLGAFIVEQAIAIGNLNAKENGKCRGAELFAKATWSRYRRLVGEKSEKKVTIPSILALIGAMEQGRKDNQFVFWATLISHRMQALRKGLTHISFYSKQGAGGAEPTIIAMGTVDMIKFVPELLPLLESIPPKQISTRKAKYQNHIKAIAECGKYSLANSARDAMDKMDARMDKMAGAKCQLIDSKQVGFADWLCRTAMLDLPTELKAAKGVGALVLDQVQKSQRVVVEPVQRELYNEEAEPVQRELYNEEAEPVQRELYNEEAEPVQQEEMAEES
jgi:hypothetical protein